MDEWNISVEEAAKIMGKSKDFIFLAIQNGFIKGIVIQNKTRRTAHIPRKPFFEYMTCSKKEPSQELIEALIEKYESSEKEIKKLDDKILELNRKIIKLSKTK